MTQAASMMADTARNIAVAMSEVMIGNRETMPLHVDHHVLVVLQSFKKQ